MKGLREKICKREGFTLVEMLIVVAIIAILIMVSIPMFSANLEKARHAVDEANIRSAVGLASAMYLTANDTEKAALEAGEYKYFVDEKTHQGRLATSAAAGSDEKVVTPQCEQCKNEGGELTVTVKAVDGSATASWSTSP